MNFNEVHSEDDTETDQACLSVGWVKMKMSERILPNLDCLTKEMEQENFGNSKGFKSCKLHLENKSRSNLPINLTGIWLTISHHGDQMNHEG